MENMGRREEEGKRREMEREERGERREEREERGMDEMVGLGKGERNA